ncbi:unannotated protein [freshwater metagenome]|uniref:Unannotated protein n=1 Tax=freshwater metagenome TaxID=449393 RepID=A0A6J6GJ07_9ZZZZ
MAGAAFFSGAAFLTGAAFLAGAAFSATDVADAGFRSMLRRPGMISTTSSVMLSPSFITSRAERGGGLL